MALILLAVMLDPGNAQSRHSATVDRALPAGELLEAERIALADIVDAEKSASNLRYDLGLTANDPAGRVRWRQRIEGEWFAKRTDYLRWPKFLILKHAW